MLAEEAQTITESRRPNARRHWWKNRTFLLVSIGAHFLFGLGAAYVVVSRYSDRKLTFKAGPKSPNPTERAIQHRVQLQEKTKRAPAVVPKRVLSSGAAKIELPPLPSLGAAKEPSPPAMRAAAGQSAGFALHPGTMGSVGGTGTGAAINFFGIRDKSSSVAIMIDFSDSMFTRTGDADGRKLAHQGKEQNFQTVRDEAISLVNSLGSNVQFGIVRWAGSAHSWKPELIPATEENKRAAITHIQNEVDMKSARPKKGEAGGTRHDLALQTAFSLQPEVIYMLTDGNATMAEHKGGLKPIPPEEIFKVADAGQKSLRRPARLHVIYYLTGAERQDERQMLMSLASRNNGQFRPV